MNYRTVSLTFLTTMASCVSTPKGNETLKESNFISSVNRIAAIDSGMTMRKIIAGIESPEYDINSFDSLTVFYYRGSLKQVTRYNNGSKNGVHLEFDSHGNLYMEGRMRDGVSDGIWRTYDSTGRITEIEAIVDGNAVWSERKQPPASENVPR